MEYDVRLWDVTPRDPAGASSHGELANPLHLDQPIAQALAFSPNGRLLATADPGHVVLWSLADPHSPTRLGAVEVTVPKDAAMVVVDEGRTLLLSGSDSALAAWDITDPTVPRRTGGPPPGGGHQRVALSRDGELLATADGDGGAELWDLADRIHPRQLGLALQDGDTVAALAFSADGQSLATATDKGTTRLWGLQGLRDLRRDPAAPACQIVGSGLTPDEWVRYVSGLAYVKSCP
jgi:WD40 repeat protein